MIELTIGSDKRFIVEKRKDTTYINGTPAAFECQKTGEHTFRVIKDNRIYLVEVLEREDREMVLNVNGQSVPVKTSDHFKSIG